MLRTLALVLLLANVLLLAALAGVFDATGGASSEREPERLQRQHQPGLVRVLSPQAASAALSAATAATAQAAAVASGDQTQTLACLEAGPFSASDATAAERTLREAGLAPGAWQVQRQDDQGAFMIYMGRYADPETVQRKLAELKRRKLDGEDLRGAPELQPGISLGRFDNLASANAAMAEMAENGLRTARVITLRQAQSQTLLRVPAADATLRARLAGLQLPSGPGFLPCVAGAATVAVPGASEPAATVASAPASQAGARPTPGQASAVTASAPRTAASASANAAASRAALPRAAIGVAAPASVSASR